MRKPVITLKEARPAIKNLITAMKKKYSGRNIQFQSVSQLSDEDIDKKMPNKAKSYLNSNPNHIRKIGHDSGIDFYYYKLKDTSGGEINILPIIIFNITRKDNSGNQSNKLLVCSLNTYLPRITKEEVEELDNLLESVIKNNRT